MEISGNFILSESDKRVLGKLKDFIPDKIFDFHAHLYHTAYLPDIAGQDSIFAERGDLADRAFYERYQCQLHPGIKKLRLNLVSMPDSSMNERPNGNRARCNDFLIEHLEQYPQDIGEAFVLPDDTGDEIKGLLNHPNIRGFKCYHVCAAKKPTWQAEIDEYLPESAWRVAEDRGLCITLHMVKDAALADPGNYTIISEKARKYPNVKLILAHAARGFAPWTVIEGVKGLSEIPNIYFDVSAVCEPTAIFTVVKAAGHERVLWGSDFPVSMLRGKCVSLADTFLWLYWQDLEKLDMPAAADANLVGVENLNALAQACGMLDLNHSETEDIFYNNAERLFGSYG